MNFLLMRRAVVTECLNSAELESSHSTISFTRYNIKIMQNKHTCTEVAFDLEKSRSMR